MIILYVMLFGWGKFRGWLVLEFFLETGRRIHVNGLAKRLKISVSTVHSYLLEYEKQGVLEKECTANIVSYRVKETPLTLELKKTFFISKVLPFVAKFMNENPFVTTLALFGSHAKGTFDEKSDIDLLAISPQKNPNLASLKQLEEKTGKETKIQVFSIAEWKNLLRKNDSFALAVIRNNILLFGDQL
jgi:predicted nucleotidyltransferase